jgi:hypothetical protein
VHYVATKSIYFVGVARDNRDSVTKEQILYVKTSAYNADKLVALNHIICGFAVDLLIGA